MYLGRLFEVAPKAELYSQPISPYTQALLSAAPTVDPSKRRERIILTGDVPSPINLPPGCRFSSRCFKRLAICDEVEPELVEARPGHFCACHLLDKA
jgi:peptide/nickel transport system ATP-binding protein